MYIVIGGSGFLGRYIIKTILELATDNVVATYYNSKPSFCHKNLQWLNVDVQNDADLIKLNNLTLDNAKVIYLSAYHHPDKVEENPYLAWDINITALSKVVNLLRKVSCFYYSSTDTVYGEGSSDYKFKETDSLNPVNLYGKHKVLAEQIVLASGGNVVRFPFIIGKSLSEGKKHFFDKIIEDLQSNKVVEMFNDSYRSTLSFNQCAKYLIMLIEKYGKCKEPIINIASDKPLTKYDVAFKICKDFNLDELLLKGISIDNCSSIFKVKRAKNTVLDNTKLKELLNLKNIDLEWE